jgi:hypothetical protein
MSGWSSPVRRSRCARGCAPSSGRTARSSTPSARSS